VAARKVASPQTESLILLDTTVHPLSYAWNVA
jgi:hypothetical protein